MKRYIILIALLIALPCAAGMIIGTGGVSLPGTVTFDTFTNSPAQLTATWTPGTPAGATYNLYYADNAVASIIPANFDCTYLLLTGYNVTGTAYPGTPDATAGKYTGLSGTSYTISGPLTEGTTYCARITGVSSGSVEGLGSTPLYAVAAAPPQPGDAFGGGYYVGTISDGGTNYRLIAAPYLSVNNAEWDADMYPIAAHCSVDPETWLDETGCVEDGGGEWIPDGFGGTVTTGVTSTTNGPANTATLVTNWPGRHTAAESCNSLTSGGYSDWYLPAINELTVLYGVKSAMVTAGVLSDGLEVPWSSTEVDNSSAKKMYLNIGSEGSEDKSIITTIIPFRRIPQ